MELYRRNGAQLGWLLLPEEQLVEIWPAEGDPERLDQARQLEGGPAFPRLRLDLAKIWAG